MPRPRPGPRGKAPSREGAGRATRPAGAHGPPRRRPQEARPARGPARRPVGKEPVRRGSDTIEGWNPVLEALRAGRPISKILIAQDIARHSGVAETLARSREAGVVVERVDRHVIDRLSPTGLSQGVLAMTAAKEYASLADILAAAREKGEPPLLVLLDGIVDPQNLGAIIRTAEAAGVHGVVIPERRAVGLTAAVARASSGALEYVPVARVPNMAGALANLARENVWSVGVDPSGAEDYTRVDYRQPTAMVIGAEGRGLSRLVRERCDLVASIPMRGKIASLNASVASALIMYEALRQRRPPQG